MFLRRLAFTCATIIASLFVIGCARTPATSVPSAGAEFTEARAAAASTDDFPEPPAYFATLVEQARARVDAAYTPVRTLDEGSALARMRYDEHRRIRFRPEASLFRGEPGRFEVQFFHLGGTSRTPIDVSIVDRGTSRPYPYDRASFVFDTASLPDALVAPAYSGFRIHAPINTDAYRDEVIVFQGASYFRAVARRQAYGLSARGLAIDTGTSRPEEFPVFDAFHIVRPSADDAHVWVLASLSSPRAEGAYAFRITPGERTRAEVTARVFVREGIEVLGLAPLTSMYLFGEDRPARFGDFRPEVHDSDTLVLEGASGERIARPLRNPPRTTVSTHRLDAPRGFGLAQRDRSFDSYQDLEARYHERPSVWVTPIGDWGPGAMRLLEIATELETDDNIAAMWTPDVVPTDGLSLRYVVEFAPEIDRGVGARVVATRVARITATRTRFLVDFVGASLTGRDVVVEASAAPARVIEAHVEDNPHTGGRRASFEIEAASPADEVELRAFLRSGDDALSETWSYLWQPTR